MFSFLAGWPVPLIWAIVGGAMGAIGGSLGYIVGKKSRKAAIFCTILAISASRPITENFVMPIIENDIANAGLPRKVDEVTTMNRIEIDGRDIRYFFALDKSVPVVTPEELKTAIGLPACSFWKDQFASGKYVSARYSYDFTPSGTASFTLTRSDCS